MLPPREEVEGKIRAMRAAGHADHEIGYAIGWDFGLIKGRMIADAKIRQIEATCEARLQKMMDLIRLMEQMKTLDERSGKGARLVCLGFGFLAGFLACFGLVG